MYVIIRGLLGGPGIRSYGDIVATGNTINLVNLISDSCLTAHLNRSLFVLFSVVKGPQEAQMVTLALQDTAGRRLGLAEGLQGVAGIL